MLMQFLWVRLPYYFIASALSKPQFHFYVSDAVLVQAFRQ
jgi:hypothetical protein